MALIAIVGKASVFRRTNPVLAAGLLVAVQSAGFLAAPATGAAASAVSDLTGLTSGGVLQVVAHEDDDLLFMNPDVSRSIAAGSPSTTVYLTAGQLSGDGGSASERARNRQRGAQNAYAAMAGVSDSDDTTQLEWDGEVWQTGTRGVERYWLRDRPWVQLLFVNLPDGGLKKLNAGGAANTVIPAEGLVTTGSHYTRSDAVATLGEILQAYRPLLLRLQDPEPDQRIRPSTESFGPSHPDHVNGGLMTREAAVGYPGPLYEVAYRDYNTTDSQPNLAPEDIARKTAIMDSYYTFDRAFQRMHLGELWLDRQYYHWSRGTEWATLDSEGRLRAFVVRNGQLWEYPKTSSGVWSGPDQLASAGGQLAPGVAVGHEVDGRLAVFAHRLSDHHVVVLRQDAPGGKFQTAWTDLGRPNSGSASAELIGTPVAARDSSGRLVVFVRNARDGVSALAQIAGNGPWDPTAWTTLPGEDVQDGLSAITTPEGEIELFASTRSTLLHWRHSDPNGVFQLDPLLSVIPAASPPRAFLDASGRVSVAYLQPGTSELTLIHQEAGSWSSPVSLGATGETTQPATTLVSTDLGGRVLIFARNQTSGISVSVPRQPTVAASGWTDLGGTVFDQPAAVTDTAGEATVLVLTPQGLRAAQVTLSGDQPVLSVWTTVDH